MSRPERDEVAALWAYTTRAGAELAELMETRRLLGADSTPEERMFTAAFLAGYRAGDARCLAENDVLRASLRKTVRWVEEYHLPDGATDCEECANVAEARRVLKETSLGGSARSK